MEVNTRSQSLQLSYSNKSGQFVIDLSSRKLPHLSRKEQAAKHIVLKSPDTDNVLIRFNLGVSSHLDKDKNGIIKFS